MNYAQVLMAFNNQLKNPNGDRYIASREGWNGADQYIGLCTSWNGNLLASSTDFEMVPFTYIKTTQNKFVPWVPSQTDQLAEDWIINVVPAIGGSTAIDEDTDGEDKPTDDVLPNGQEFLDDINNHINQLNDAASAVGKQVGEDDSVGTANEQ